MKFRLKNDYKGKRKGDIIEISADMINKLRAMDVLGKPVKEFNIEKAVIKSKEKQIIRSKKEL